MVILNQNDLRMKELSRNDRDENPPILAYFLPNDPGMTNFCHSNVIPSFEDEDEWDEVDQFPYRETHARLAKHGQVGVNLSGNKEHSMGITQQTMLRRPHSHGVEQDCV